MHCAAMQLFKKSQGANITEYVPIARAFSTLDKDSEEILTKKFELAFFFAKKHSFH